MKAQEPSCFPCPFSGCVFPDPHVRNFDHHSKVPRAQRPPVGFHMHKCRNELSTQFCHSGGGSISIPISQTQKQREQEGQAASEPPSLDKTGDLTLPWSCLLRLKILGHSTHRSVRRVPSPSSGVSGASATPSPCQWSLQGSSDTTGWCKVLLHVPWEVLAEPESRVTATHPWRCSSGVPTSARMVSRGLSAQLNRLPIQPSCHISIRRLPAHKEKLRARVS